VEKFVALLFSGIAYGAVLSLVALGFLVLYKATGVINFAHGDLVTLGGYVSLWLVVDHGMPTVAGYALAVVLMFGVGVVLERLAYAPLRKRPTMSVVIATLAAAIALRGFIAVWQGSTPKSLPTPVGTGVVHIAGAAVAKQRLMIIGVAAIAVLVLLYVFQRTAYGRQVRALAHSPDTARLLGVRTRIIAVGAFGMSAALAALAGLLIAPLSTVNLDFGFSLMVAAFAAAVLGGFGSFNGVIIGSLVIGLVQQLLGGYVFTGYQTTLPFVLMFAVIAVRPEGLIVLTRSRL
jgi:branched-chain amino acid transport system permease protein